ncbi:flagellin [Peptostreptococcaceae bacterium AGR-M142]
MNALNAHRRMSNTVTGQSKAIEKLSSGMRINRAGDDAAGLAISEKMRAQIRGMHQASRNAQDGISMIQTAEGALDETSAMLTRIKELAVQAANDTNATGERKSLQLEVAELKDAINKISRDTKFNSKTLLDSDAAKTPIILQVGANRYQDLAVTFGDMSITGLSISSMSVGTRTGSASTLEVVEAGISQVAEQRAKFGATQNRLEHTIKSIDNTAENLQAAESRIRDTDMAKEMMNMTRLNILQQSAQAMLSQANQQPQNILQLLR